MELQNKTLVFLGDSITEGCGTSGGDVIFHQRIKHRFGLKDAVNCGISGTRFAYQIGESVNPRWDLNFCDRAKELDPTADGVVVFGGTNDFGHGNAPMGVFSDREPTTFYGACHTLFTTLIHLYVGKPVIVMTPLHRLEEDSTACGLPLIEYVKAIREVAEYYALPVLDLYAMSGLQPNVAVIRERFIPDGLHPNDDGHAVLAERVGNFLAKL